MKLITAIIFLLHASISSAQELGQVTFAGGANISYFSFMADQGLFIRISEDGKVLEWGIEVRAIRSDYYAPKLQPYMGRVDYYGPEADSAFRGKVKSIGTSVITYYSHYDMDTKVGKIRSIGTIILDYYTNYENKVHKGKLRFIGNLLLEHYSSFENEAYKDKLKSIGNTVITYYSSFDDKFVKGKIKSIGSVPYTWYTSFELRGGLKSGMYRRNIGGITYIVQ